MMNILCYCPSTDEGFHDILTGLQETSPDMGLEFHRSLDSFTSRLRQPGRNIAVVLLHIDDKQTLTDLMAVRSLLNELPVVIIPNDQNQEIIKLSHEFKPRVIIHAFWQAKDICAVLQRCIDRYGSGGRGRKGGSNQLEMGP
ncbi:MAG: hypothetical protein ACYC6Q_03495 [Syntrophales bacterium]